MKSAESRPIRADASACRLLILDDFFPNLLTGFRVAEFNSLFRAFPNARCESTARDYLDSKPAYARCHPEFTDRVSVFTARVAPETDLVYCVGLNTLEFFRPFIEMSGVPFVLELYPGFGLRLNGESDGILEAAFRSPCFRKVIITQTAVLDYVQRRFHLPPGQVVYKYGGPITEAAWPDAARRDPDAARRGLASARSQAAAWRLEVGFVAAKYMPGGLDKGYDVFIDAARRLAESLPDRVGLHVVGPWGPDDRPLGTLRPGRDIFFHGYRTRPFFRTLHRGLDAIVSPNRAGMLAAGTFDGFPTASVVDAMACGVAAFATDPLHLNHELRAGREFVLIEPDPESTADAILQAFRSPGGLAQIGERGRQRVLRLFDLDCQMTPRIAALSAAAAEPASRGAVTRPRSNRSAPIRLAVPPRARLDVRPD
jgi:glycosyltransferase involved in cell wall biosynthesis